MKKRIKFFFVIFILVSIVLFYVGKDKENIKDKAYLSVWNVYWDIENVHDEIALLQGAAKEICYFAAYFDSNHTVFIPEGTNRIFSSISNHLDRKEYSHYLTIVNDKINTDGTVSLKDTDLLYELFKDEKRMEEHVEEIVTLAVKNGYDGVEIDYERIQKDRKLWNLFIDFCQKLYFRLEENGMKMRVILEPSASLQGLTFPVGPDYVMMCYNLHGKHSVPGPKADKGFLLDLVEKMADIKGTKYFAFATGGFDWDDQGGVSAITEKAAQEILEKYDITPIRDDKSQSLTFQYMDEDHVNHEVWFADATTLLFWMDIVKSTGNNRFSLWRLNGNREESLYKIGKYIKDI